MRTSFDQFLKIFPEAALPVVIGEDAEHEFSISNPPIPALMIEDHILPLEEDADELTEFIACFRIGGLKDFQATVYWKAGVMNYQYVLCTWGKGGKLIDRHVIGGTFSDGNAITRSFARIDEDHTIYIVSGQADKSGRRYEAARSTTVELELLPDGKIVELV
ncbi:MAG: hypothetical protein EPO28_10840 [Saprospiraceae bacterium]|nr:MAG: hypothetical protein EPO28_10840 [Saprospiraceae bacterium]